MRAKANDTLAHAFGGTGRPLSWSNCSFDPSVRRTEDESVKCRIMRPTS
jgi:hypothetical protein